MLMRLQAWERAKGELRSAAMAFDSPKDTSAFTERYKRYSKLLKEFVRTVEEEGLVE